MIQALIFDLDETLVDSREAILAFWRGLFARLGRPFPPEEQHFLFYTKPVPDTVARFLPDEEGQRGYREYRAAVGVGRTLDGARLKPGTPAALDWCYERFLLALITNRGPTAVPLLEQLKLDHYFRLVITGDTTLHFKPHPWGVEHVLAELALSREEALFVGDSSADIECAANAGVRSVGIGGNWKLDSPLSPTWELDSIADLPRLLTEIQAREAEAPAPEQPTG